MLQFHNKDGIKMNMALQIFAALCIQTANFSLQGEEVDKLQTGNEAKTRWKNETEMQDEAKVFLPSHSHQTKQTIVQIYVIEMFWFP